MKEGNERKESKSNRKMLRSIVVSFSSVSARAGLLALSRSTRATTGPVLRGAAPLICKRFISQTPVALSVEAKSPEQQQQQQQLLEEAKEGLPRSTTGTTADATETLGSSGCPVIGKVEDQEKTVLASTPIEEPSPLLETQRIPTAFKVLGLASAGTALSMSISTLGIIGMPELGSPSAVLLLIL